MIRTRIFLFIFFVAVTYEGLAFGWMQTLSERASNPITNLSQLQFENDISPQNYGTKEHENRFYIKPLIALNKSEAFPFEQLIRFYFQIPTLPKSPKTRRGTALGDTQFFDLFITEEPSWGRWGIGPMAIFPTATRLDAGQGKWQIGPAAGLSILKYAHWQIGFLAQNPISVAGNRQKSRQNYLLFQPFLIYHFLKNSYFITNGQWTIDWQNHTKQIPVNIGIGYTSPADSTKYRVDSLLQFEWMAYQNAQKLSGYVNQFTVQLNCSLLFN